MVLLIQLGAVLLTGLVAAAVWSKSRPSSQAVARAIVILALVFGYLAFWGKVWKASDHLLSERSQSQKLTQAQAAVAGTPPGVNTSFAQWIKRRLEPGERYYLVSKGSNSEQVYQWFTYVLSPNLATTDPRQADWLIFYGDSAASSPYVQLIRAGAQRFEWGYSIAKVSHAS
jgi:hypothetical protein